MKKSLLVVATLLWKAYYKFGALLCEGNYINGKEEDLFKSYHESGELKFEASYTNGVMTDNLEI